LKEKNMAQNINLLADLNVRSPAVLNSSLTIQISISWVFILIFIYLVTYVFYAIKQKELLNLETIQKNLTSRIATYKKALPGINIENKDVKSSYEPSLTSIKGFYGFLEDLANFVPQGIWVNDFVISKEDNSVTITGTSILSSGPSVLINALSKSTNFRDKKFVTIRLLENTNTHNTDFTITTNKAIYPKPT